MEGHDIATTTYVTYAWESVVAHREVDLEGDLPAEPPKEFEELRLEILAFGEKADAKDRIADEEKLGLYLIVRYGIRGY